MTDEEKKTVVQEVLNQIKTDSQSVDELETATSLDSVNSLPAMQGEKVVRVPVSLLAKPAEDAAKRANAAAATADASSKAAGTAAQQAKAAADVASGAALTANNSAMLADAATAKLNDAIAAANTHPVVLANSLVGDADRIFSDWSEAMETIAGNESVGGEKVFTTGCVMIFRSADGWESWQFTGDPLDDLHDAEKWQEYATGGSGGNTYNVTEEIPLESGYYTLATAIVAVEEKKRAKGRCITYETVQGKWETKQFIGTSLDSWEQAASWEDFGGAGNVKSISVNGKKQTLDSAGNVNLTINETEVDESLNANSTNPVQNAAVAAKLAEVEANTIFGGSAELSDDESTVRVTLTNKSGTEVVGLDIPAGKGGGGGETSTTKIVLTAETDKSVIKEGDKATLTWFYDHQYSSGDEKGTSTGQKATVEIQIKRGATLMYSDTQQDVSKGTYTLDLTKYLLLGTTDIYVKATTTDPTTGKTQTKQSYVSVKAVTLALTSGFNIAECIAKGGYGVSENVGIPYAVSGSGTKTVTLYVDGIQNDSVSVTRSGATNGSFTLSMSGLAVGRHTVQMVAEMKASEELTLKSESIYFDILKTGSSAPYIGTKITFKDGRIFTADHLTPTIDTGQYEQVLFDFVAYDPTATPASMSVWRDGIRTQTVSVPRTTQVYTNRFLEQGDVAMVLKCGTTEYKLNVKVTESGIDLSEATAGLVLKLTAAGRSNAESEPAEWRYNDVQTAFEGFDWQSNGWTGDALKLTNGANVEIGYKPFGNDATTTGATYEMELTCTNVTDRRGTVVDCMTGGVGFRLTTQEALMRTGAGSEVGTKFASGLTLKIAFVVQEKKGNRLMMLYVNGILCGAKQYASTDSLLQAEPTNIKITSESADVEVRNLRVYSRALGDDEELANYMVDRPTSDEMVVLFEKNQVMDDEGTDVDIDKLRAMGKSVMRIVGDVNLVNQTNNKKFEVPVDIYFYSAYGKEYDFIIYQCGLRIQGTSSTTYPRKNYRIYFSRSTKYGTKLYVNGVEVADFKYSFKPGARPIDIFCLKADFSDSSSTHNTGAVRVVNDIWKRCGWLTPPQMAYKGNYDVRIGVDGFPIDLFCDNNGTGENVYLGKYNFNNEKSGSGIIYGFEGIEGFNDEATLKGGRNKCICLEFLNNSETLCLFGTSNMDTFDDALEFRFKADDTWATAHEEDKAAVKRLWEWIYSCKGNPTKFLNEYAEYFGNDSPFAWYLITDYFMAVDNRAKNMMLVTWDGKIWYFIPYDMDTVFGERNDSVLKYDYTITWETMDESIGSYAFAGHDSVLWELVRGCPDKLREVADKLRSTMSLEYVLKVFNEEMMGNWCERIYNKDGIYKYIKPLTEGVTTADGTTSYYDYLYALQGSRYAHRTYTIQNRFALLDSQYVCGTYRKDSFAAYFGYKFGSDNRKIRITASERYFFGYGYTSDESVADDANISNLDNGTGFKYGNDYKPSGHIEAIFKNRHRVLAKVTKKATTRNVNIANVDTVVNNLDGEMTYCPLADTDSNKYYDGTVAKLDGTEGDWMMYEPFFWSKGINDFLNGKNYSCYSSRDKDHMPTVPNVDVLTLADIKARQGGYTSGKKIMSGKDTIKNSYSTDSTYSVCMVDVSGYKKVRWPSVPGTNLVGSIFADASGNVVKDIVVPTLGSRFEAGMYLISDVPEGATALYFSILNTAEFDKVVLSNSEKIEDMEPEWFANDEHLCAVVGSSVVGSKLRSAITGNSTTGSMSWTDFHYYSVQRGMQQIDALMHFRIANLSYAKYGRRNMQEQCGAGQHSYMRTTGGTASRGMQDTIGFEEASGINPNVTNNTSDAGVHLYAWYIEKDEYGATKVTQVNNICCIGYEDIYGNKYDMMDGVDLPNTSGNVGKWRIWLPDGTALMIKGMTNSDYWITTVAHGKLMAVIPVGAMNGSSTTYYSDKYWFSSASGRVVYRGCNSADAGGGVSNARAGSDASSAGASVGSRLAFRGQIVKAQSVVAYKALDEVA